MNLNDIKLIEDRIVKEEQKRDACLDEALRRMIDSGISALKVKLVNLKKVLAPTEAVEETPLPAGIGKIVPEGKVIGYYFKVLKQKKDGSYGGIPKFVKIAGD